jgi:lysophospholipase L1-like esterase
LINEFKEQGVYDECKACWANYNQAIHQAAEAYGIPVAEVGLAWNGPDFDQDPSDLGYVKDGIHPNELGATVIAQALRETGYEPVEP